MGVFKYLQRINNGSYVSRRTNVIASGGFLAIWRNRSNFSTNISTFNGGKDEILPVLIVGAGPVGLVLSILLTKLGVKCGLLEKNMAFSQHPQAHFINNRSMEVFRKLDNLAVEIQSLQPPVELWRKFIYCTSLSGSILGSVDHIEPKGRLVS